MYFFLFILYICSCNAISTIIDLGGKNVWTFYSPTNQSFSSHQFAANVPGDIFTDLEFNKVLEKSLLFGENDINYRWIAYENWVYERNFTVPDYLLKVQLFLYKKYYRNL